MKAYLTRMIRYGDTEGHTYIGHCSTNETWANIMGKWHGKDIRGGKYDHLLITIDIPDNCKIIYVKENNLNQENSKYEYQVLCDDLQVFTLAEYCKIDSRITPLGVDDPFTTDKDFIKSLIEIDYIFNYEEVSFLKQLLENNNGK